MKVVLWSKTGRKDTIPVRDDCVLEDYIVQGKTLYKLEAIGRDLYDDSVILFDYKEVGVCLDFYKLNEEGK
jgi:hypothetical protein